jgi:hypothetical protein
MVGRICPPGWDRVKVSENLGATTVAPVAPVGGLVGVSGFTPSLIPALQNIDILQWKQAKLRKHLQHSVPTVYTLIYINNKRAGLNKWVWRSTFSIY